jgi:hypothetical protein
MSAPPREDLIPWSWAITPLPFSNRQCPPPAILLGTFAGVNVAATAFGIILGNRKVSGKILYVLSCGRFGKKQVGSSQAYKFMWIFPLALNLGANALNAWITVTAKDYYQSTMPRIWDLTLFYCTRPRLGWIPLTMLAYRGAVCTDMENPKDGLWTSAGRQAAIAEAIMGAIGTYYMGRTVHFGAIHDYYPVHHTDFQNGVNLRLMIAGSLVFVVYMFVSVVTLFSHGFSFFLCIEGKQPGDVKERFSAGYYFLFLSGMPWVGSWLFITGYARLAGDL